MKISFEIAKFDEFYWWLKDNAGHTHINFLSISKTYEKEKSGVVYYAIIGPLIIRLVIPKNP